MLNYYIIFNNKISSDLGCKIVERPVIPVPEKQIEVINVPGRNGALHIDKGGFNDIKIPVQFYINSKDNLKERFREIKAWLNIIRDNKLILGDDPSYFYKVVTVNISTGFETQLWEHGIFTVEFTCRPFMYKIDGQIPKNLPSQIFNDLDYICEPTYEVIGEGLISIICNGYEVKLNVGQSMIVDTENGLVYRENEYQNNKVTGNIEKLKIIPGINTFNTKLGTGAKLTSIKIKYNWRCL